MRFDNPLAFTLLSLLSTTIGPVSAQTEPPIVCPPATTIPSTWTRYAFTLKYPLNFPFLSRNAASAAQICQHGGAIVAHAIPPALVGGEGPAAGASTWGIEPVDLSDSLGYVASAMVVSAPPGLLEVLNELVGNATSALYNPPESLARQIAQQIDDEFEVVMSKFSCSIVC